MFDQESFDNATTPMISPEPQQGGFLENYEIRSWFSSPSLYKVLAISAVINFALIGVMAQTNVLTARGCDSPWVGRVCQVVDMAYVGAMLFGTEREYVDEVYERIDLGDADITFIDVTGETPPLSYPEGYFQIANPVQYAMLRQAAENPDGAFPPVHQGFVPPSTSGSDLLRQSPKLPARNPNAFKDDSGSSLYNQDNGLGSVASRKGRGGRVTVPSNVNSNQNVPSPDTTAETNTKQGTPQITTPTNPAAGIEINKRPMVDLGNWVNEMIEKNDVDLQTQFIVNARGKLDNTGRLDPKSFAYVTAMSSDEDMVEIVKRSIEAINVAGYLQYLKDLSGKDFNLLLQQDTENLSAVAQSEMESETRANTVRSGLNALFSILKMQKSSPNADQNDKDDLLLLENTKVETEGRKVIIRFTVPKALAHPMIQRKLAEQAAELQKPSGLAPSRSSDTSAR